MERLLGAPQITGSPRRRVAQYFGVAPGALFGCISLGPRAGANRSRDERFRVLGSLVNNPS